MNIEIEPYSGIKYDRKAISFGMTQDEIKIITGEIVEPIEFDISMGEVWEERREMFLVYIKDELKDIRFRLDKALSTIKLFIYNREIDEKMNLIKLLKQYDKEVTGKNGYSNFYGLGISAGGYDKIKMVKKELTIFSKDRVDFYKYFLEY